MMAITGNSTVHVRLLVWGVTEADQERAISRAAFGEARASWQFVTVERQSGTRCPIDTRNPDPKAIAVESDDRWAYAVYPANYDLPAAVRTLIHP
jgi:hypothetical protein